MCSNHITPTSMGLGIMVSLPNFGSGDTGSNPVALSKKTMFVTIFNINYLVVSDIYNTFAHRIERQNGSLTCWDIIRVFSSIG